MAVAIRAADLRIRGTIMQPHYEPNPHGDPAELVYTPLADVYASVRPLSGQQLSDARQEYGGVTHEMITRHLDGVKADCQFVWRARGRTRTVEFLAVLDAEERGVMLRIPAKEVA